MSWLKKLWRGEARFWQAFWLGFAILFGATFALGLVIGERIESGAMSFEQFHQISAYFQIAMLVLCAVWLLVLTRGMHRARMQWSAWLGIVFVIYIIGTSTFNITLFALHGGEPPVGVAQDGEMM